MPHIAFDRAADFYDSTRGFADGVAERIRDAILAYTGADRGSRFLELGVGTGRIAAPFFRRGYDYTGVDISRPMMERLVQKLATAPDGPPCLPRLLQADVTHLALAERSFDVAIVVHVLHLVDGWQTAVKETERVLRRPGGRLLICRDEHEENVASSPHRRVNRRWSAILSELGIDRVAPRPGLGHDGAESQDEALEGLLREMGACTEHVVLVEHAGTPLSARDRAQRHLDRVYSADWMLPDEIHAEACRRMKSWLESRCPEPDRPVAEISRFQALAAQW